MTNVHLAQINIGRMKAPLEDPAMAGFVARLDDINALADRSSGFVWRLQTEEGNATYLRPFDDERIIVNMSVWESIDALRAYVYGSAHAEVLRQRREWFEKFDRVFLALWWIPAATSRRSTRRRRASPRSKRTVRRRSRSPSRRHFRRTRRWSSSHETESLALRAVPSERAAHRGRGNIHPARDAEAFLLPECATPGAPVVLADMVRRRAGSLRRRVDASRSVQQARGVPAGG